MLQALILLKPRDVPMRVALRNSIAVVAPLAVGVAIGQVPAGLAIATGALNTMFTDLPGPYRQRMQRMLIAAASAGLSALAGVLVGPHTALLVAMAVLFGFVGGMLVALGPVAARTGLTSMIVMLITADMRLAPAQAPGIAALIFAGGMLQMLFAVAAWPLQRYRPERFALAQLLQQLADVARTRPDALQPPPVSVAAMDAMQLLHGRHRARGAAVQAFRVIAELCERVRVDLLSLGDLHARLPTGDGRAALEHVLDGADTLLRILAGALREARPPRRAEATLVAFDTRVEALVAAIDASAEARERRLLRICAARAQSLAGQLRALTRNADWASSRGDVAAERAEARLPAALRPGNPLQTLRANLALSSIAMRHALRCAVCLGLAVTVERALAIPHGVWIPMTAAIVLKPDFGGTLSFGALRVAGTLAGLLLTTLIAHYAMDGVVLRLVLMLVLCLAFRLLAQVNYGLGVAMLTGMLVLLLSFEGMAPGDAIELRIACTLGGSALALAAYVLWPTWEGRSVDVALATLLDRYRAHINAVLSRDAAALRESRTAARAARTVVQAALERLRAEPRRLRWAATHRPRAESDLPRAESILANANRLIRASLSLEAAVRDVDALPARVELDAFAARVDVTLAAIAEALRRGDSVRVPSLRPDERRLAEALDAPAAAPPASPATIDPLLQSDPAIDTSSAAPTDSAVDTVRVALADTCDRIADSVDTLAHLLRPADAAPRADMVPTADG